MNLENIRDAHENDGSIDAWGDFVLELDAIEGGPAFVDFVEDKVAARNFAHAVLVDLDSDEAFANAYFMVAVNALRSGEFRKIASALPNNFWA